jgi:halocyanin-like protein
MSGSRDVLGRRGLLRVCGAVALTGLAGCSGNSADSGGSDGGAGGNVYGGWLDDANGFEAVDDRTGESSIEITVGAGSGLAFEPAAVRISPGTQVVWTWTSKGGAHNVREENDAFESELIGQSGHTFEYTFDSAGVYKYVCDPHAHRGMKGVVEVVEE